MFEVNIDFDEASAEWHKNKVHLGNGVYRYRCQHFSDKKQQYCKNKPTNKSIYCHFHNKKFQKN